MAIKSFLRDLGTVLRREYVLTLDIVFQSSAMGIQTAHLYIPLQ